MQEKHYLWPSAITCIMDTSGSLMYSSINQDMALQLLETLDLKDILGKTGKEELIRKEWVLSIQNVALCCNQYIIIQMQRCKNQELPIEASAFTDEATSLYNRNLWEKISTKKLQSIGYTRYGIIMLDIDNLKAINDELGHLTGDKAIKIVADSIKESIRQTDLAFRYGGDEFLIALPEIENEGKLEEIINRIRKTIEEKEKYIHFLVDVSVGGAFCKEHCQDQLKGLIMQADQAMYREKKDKRRRYLKIANDLFAKEIKEKFNLIKREIASLVEEKDLKNKIDIILKEIDSLKNELQ